MKTAVILLIDEIQLLFMSVIILSFILQANLEHMLICKDVCASVDNIYAEAAGVTGSFCLFEQTSPASRTRF